MKIVPYAPDIREAARLIDADASPVASVTEPDGPMHQEAFRDAVFEAAIDHESGAVAGILFAARWGGGGIMMT